MKSRFDYVRFDSHAEEQRDDILCRVLSLEAAIETLVDSGRAKTLALTSLEECFMWIGKAIGDEQLHRASEIEEEASNDYG